MPIPRQTAPVLERCAAMNQTGKLQILLDFWNDPKVTTYELVGRTTLSKKDISNWLEASIETIDIGDRR